MRSKQKISAEIAAMQEQINAMRELHARMKPWRRPMQSYYEHLVRWTEQRMQRPELRYRILRRLRRIFYAEEFLMVAGWVLKHKDLLGADFCKTILFLYRRDRAMRLLFGK